MNNMPTKCITEAPLTENGDVNLLADDASMLRKLPVKMIRDDVIHKITDPEQYPLSTETAETPQNVGITPVMEVGGLSKSKGTPSERSDAVRTAEFLPLSGGRYTFTNGKGFKMYVICYDESQKILPAWYESNTLTYALINDGDKLTIPDTTVYLKFYCSDTADTTITFIISGEGSGTVTNNKYAEFVKQYFANGEYTLGCTELDPGLWQLELRALREGFAIFAIKPPKEKPHEATIALSLSGTNTKQFVDFSCMRYDETVQGQVCIICQKRGSVTPLPYFFIGFNDGTGAGRVQKFRVNPDAIPMQLTSNGVKVRRYNNYDNDWQDDDTVVINLAELNDKVNKMHMALVANGIIVEGT